MVIAQTDEFELTSAPPADRRSRTSRGRWTRRPAPWLGAGVGLVLVGAVVATPIQPPPQPVVSWNLLDLDLREQPTPLWDAPISASETLGVIDSTLVVGTAVLSSTSETSDARILTGIDLATGAPVFTHADPDNTCQLGDDALTCVDDRGGPAAVIAVRDGEGAVERTHDYPDALSAVALDDGGYVVLQGAPSGVADLVRIDADGTERWRSATSFSGRVDTSYNRLHLMDGWVETASGAVDLETGEPPQDLVRFSELEADGGTAVTTSTGTVVHAASGEQVTIPPDEPLLAIDDSVAGPYALTGNDGTVVVSRRDDGEQLWRITQDECWVQARLQSTLLMRCFVVNGSRVLALDQVTGVTLWSRSDDLGASLVTASADTVVLRTADGVAGADPRTGRDRWTIPVPGTYWQVESVAGVVLVLSDAALIRLA